MSEQFESDAPADFEEAPARPQPQPAPVSTNAKMKAPAPIPAPQPVQAAPVKETPAEDFLEAPAATAAQAPSTAPPAATAQAAPAAESEMVEISDAQLHAALNKRVRDAQALVEEGRQMEAEGRRRQDEGLKAVNKAQKDYHKYFPPTTQAQNTRDYLDASNAERAARVAARGSASQLDAAKRGGNARGWNGQAQSRGPGGTRAYSRKEAVAMGLVVPGSAAAVNRGGK